ncbi:penicillin-binding protein activator [Halochromatium glycolicum]|nr:penicillin-binding protein activator [Halochromatium glycolicum]
MPAQRPGRQPLASAQPTRPSPIRALLARASNQASFNARWAMLIAAALLATSCAIDPHRDAAQALAQVPAAALADARALEQEGKPAAAAEAYLVLAEQASAPASQQLKLEAAGALVQAGDLDGANRLVLGLDQSKATAAQRQSANLLRGEIALSSGRASEAIAALQQVKPNTLTPALKRDWYGSVAAAYRMRNQPLRAAEALNDLDGLLQDRSARLGNQVSLLFTLTSLPEAQLREAARSSKGEVRGWVELAQALAGQGVPSAESDRALQYWRQRHRQHPALSDLGEFYFATLNGAYPPGTETLVLLPQSGRFGAAARTIRDGINAAFDADQGGTGPTLEFRNSSGSSYEAAVAGGTDLVIGPLSKPSVSALTDSGRLPVPTLALNRTNDTAAENLFQFALAPEDEAISAANHAFDAGVRRAAILYPQSAWGSRMAQALRRQWRGLGGSISVQPSYGSIQQGAGAVAGSDAEVILLVAKSSNIAELWAALRGAGIAVPVVATSHVYEGAFDPARHAALDGLYFVDIPWLLDQQRSEQLSRQALREGLRNISGPLSRLYAMGIDAYRLVPRVSEMRTQPGSFFPGETGGLRVNARGEIQRQLTLARFTETGVITVNEITEDSGADRLASR